MQNCKVGANFILEYVTKRICNTCKNQLSDEVRKEETYLTLSIYEDEWKNGSTSIESLVNNIFNAEII